MRISVVVLMVLLLLGGCDQSAPEQKGFAGMGDQALAFTPVVPGRVFSFPADHGAHDGFRIEWWYVTANLKDQQGNEFGVQWTLFRSALKPLAEQAGWADQTIWLGHAAVTSSTVHHAAERYARGQASYYYSQPFFQASGTLQINGQSYTVSGPAWLDREWSSQPLTANQTGWDWFSLHLDSGEHVMLYRMRQKDGAPYLTGTWIAADGQAETLRSSQIQLTPQETSKVAGRAMPVKWSISIPDKHLDITLDALNPNAWMNLRIPYWEGPVHISGSHPGQGYLEMTGY